MSQNKKKKALTTAYPIAKFFTFCFNNVAPKMVTEILQKKKRKMKREEIMKGNTEQIKQQKNQDN